jgi:lysine 2,3-aminomutase
VEGAGHFRTTVNKGVEIMEGLRGHTSGYAVPQYVIDAPGGGGKIPVQPNYVISSAPGKVVLRNFEGFLTTYSEPMDYDPNAVKHLEAQAVHRPEPGQSGVLGLLEGERLTIEPQDFEATHVRGAGHQHRLNTDAHKWQPLGIGEAPAVAGDGSDNGASVPVTVTPAPEVKV